ncbi:MAG: hypothetical protein CL484_13155 [Acidobacteria bacterium]|nr:hypothetical protein [Acidobacteriota bacterium]
MDAITRFIDFLVVAATVSLLMAGSGVARAQPGQGVVELQATLQSLTEGGEPALVSAAGMTRNNTPLLTLENLGPFDSGSAAHRLVLVGGLDGDVDSARMVLDAIRWFKTSASEIDKQDWVVSALPLAVPVTEGNDLVAGFPPVEGFFDHAERPEVRYLWRWITYQAPDLVVVFRSGSEFSLQTVSAGTGLADGSLAVALTDRDEDEGLGSVDTLVVTARPEEGAAVMREVLARAQARQSPLRLALAERVGRDPLEVARVLAQRYPERVGIAYIPAVAWVHTLRLAALTGDNSLRDKVLLEVSPWLTGEQPLFGDRIGLGAVAGTMVFSELAAVEGANLENVSRLAAEGVKQGMVERSPGVPEYGSGWSDDLFLGTIAAVRAGDAAGLSAATRLITNYAARLQQPDGLFHHAADARVAWGRGNGFSALGLAEVLTSLSEDHAARSSIDGIYRRLMAGLKAQQAPDGMWREVVDVAGSYRELSVTSMVTTAVARGVRLGWLDESYRVVAERGWRAVLAHVLSDGRLVDVCISTGAGPSQRYYLDRPAVNGADDRGGAMVLGAALEMYALSRVGL